MSNTPSNMLALGTKAPDFKLPNPSKNNELQSLESLKRFGLKLRSLIWTKSLLNLRNDF